MDSHFLIAMHKMKIIAIANEGQGHGVQQARWSHSMVNKVQGHGVQQAQWSHSMVNINSIKVILEYFVASSHRFLDIHILSFCDRVNVGQSHLQWRHTMANS